MHSYVEGMTSKGSLSSKDFVQMFLALVALFLTATTTFNTVSKRRRKLFKYIEAFPGPRRFPVIGNIPQLARMLKDPSKELLKWMAELNNDYGGCCRFWQFEDPKMVINDAEIANYLLNNDLIPAKINELVKVSLIVSGLGLITLPPDIHTQRRKMWYPSFNRKRIENATPIFRREGIKLCRKIEQLCTPEQGEPVILDMYKYAVDCTFRIICCSALGDEYMQNVSEARGREHNHKLHTIGRNLISRSFYPWLSSNFFYLNFTASGRQTRRYVREGNAMIRQAVAARRKFRAQAKLEESDAQDGKESRSDCFLDQLLDFVRNGSLDDDAVVDELNNFIIAGYDTSGLTIAYTLHELSLKQECQDKVVEELYDIVGRDKLTPETIYDYEITFADTKSMKYLELCIKETLRLYALLPILLRHTVTDVHLPDGRIIPENVDVFVNTHLIHRDPKLFPEPDEFRPERQVTPSMGYMPFSLGSRNCIGQVYGMQEVKVVLAYLLLFYKFESVEGRGFKPVYKVSLVPEKSLRLKITKRV